ncbi:MAG TPA: hypothetical protein VFG21_05065 [Xanthomonadaceae bacterium]|nr:hypothetical protein [Xanthomonadaceae bacterium]
MNAGSDRQGRILSLLAAGALVVVLGIAAAAAYIHLSTRALGAAAEDVMADWRSGDFEALFQTHAAQAFGNTTNSAELALLSELAGLREARIDWTGRGFQGPFGHVSLALVDAQGGRVPVRLRFERVSDAWRLRGIAAAAIAPVTDEAQGSPSRALLAASTDSLLRTFALSARTGTLAPLHSELSLLFQAHTDVATLDTEFGGFLEPEEDITAIIGITPQIQEVSFEGAGKIVHGKGHYAVGTSRLEFTIMWIREGAVLRALGLQAAVRHGADAAP